MKTKFSHPGQKEQYFLPFDFENIEGADRDSLVVIGYVTPDKQLIGGLYFQQKSISNIIIEARK